MIDGQTPLSIIAAAGPSSQSSAASLTALPFNQIQDQLIIRIENQYQLLEDAKLYVVLNNSNYFFIKSAIIICFLFSPFMDIDYFFLHNPNENSIGRCRGANQELMLTKKPSINLRK